MSSGLNQEQLLTYDLCVSGELSEIYAERTCKSWRCWSTYDKVMSVVHGQWIARRNTEQRNEIKQYWTLSLALTLQLSTGSWPHQEATSNCYGPRQPSSRLAAHTVDPSYHGRRSTPLWPLGIHYSTFLGTWRRLSICAVKTLLQTFQLTVVVWLIFVLIRDVALVQCINHV